MAEDLDDGELWLPSQFLDEPLMEAKLPCEFPFDSYAFQADSAVESVVSSTETESDEEDYMAGLTRRMAHSTFEEEDDKLAGDMGFAENKMGGMAGSPQSTLCTVGSWSTSYMECNSSRGSSNGPSQVSSPPTTPLEPKEDAWELLYAAAGQVVRMKLNDGTSHKREQGERGLLGPAAKKPNPSPVSRPRAPAKTTAAIPLQSCWSENGSDSHVLAAHFEYLKQQQSWNRQAKMANTNQYQNRGRVCENARNSSGRPLSLSNSAWPPLQNNAGMRAVFLGTPGSGRESCGTGVFLPRRIGNPADLRKKPACSTVLLPPKVVQALNLSFDDMGGAPHSFQTGFVHETDGLVRMDPRVAAMGVRNASFPLHHYHQKQRTQYHHQQQQKQQQSAAGVMSNSELRLPPEWTY